MINYLYSKIIKTASDRRGVAGIVPTLFMLAGVMTVTLMAGNLVSKGLVITKSQVHATKAFFASEAGAERILYEVRKNNADFVSCNPYECVEFDGPDHTDEISSSSPAHLICNVNCAATQRQQFSNNAEFFLSYFGDSASTTVTSWGSFEEVNRITKVKWAH